MNFELFLAKRLISSKHDKSSVSSPIIKIGILAIALGLIVMMISIATGVGLQHKIREKIAGFKGHVQITNYDNNDTEITLNPIKKNQEFYPQFKKIDGINRVQIFATKAGIIRTKDNFEGVILKGVGKKYNWSFFKDNLVSGTILKFADKPSNKVLISSYTANRLGLKLGDRFNMFFIKNNPNKPPNLRVFTIAGIYDTGFNQFDKNYLIGDIRNIQKLNKWNENQIGGFEVYLDDFSQLKEIGDQIYNETGSTLNSITIAEKYPAIFEWLNLFDINIIVIIGIMILVAGINMITALLVLILDRTQMIGILKSLGSVNWSIRKVFLYQAAYLIGKGLFWGNSIGLLFLLAQKYVGFIKLNPQTYYVKVVPVYLNISTILLLNLGTMVLCLLMLIIPSYIITRISPVKAIKFD